MTTPTEALRMLEKAGTAQVRRTHARHGVTRRMYGVGPAACRAIAKKLGTDQTLAATLWASGNHDARVLATLIADPGASDAATLDRWVADCDNHLIADAVSELVARTNGARQLAERWSRDLGEWRSAVGWNVVALLAAAPGGPDDDWFRSFLPAITETIHQRPNHTRHAMNGALVSIGARSVALQKDALRAASRIGPVQVDHGETEVRTPAAAQAIVELAAQRKAAAAAPPTEAAVAKPPPASPVAPAPSAPRQPAAKAATTRPAAEKRAAKKPAAKEPAAKEPAAKAPAAKKPAAKKPAAKKPAAKEPAAKKPAAKKPAAKKPAAKKPAARKPAAKKPAAKKPAAKKPAAKKAAAKRPAAGGKPRAKKAVSKRPPGRPASRERRPVRR